MADRELLRWPDWMPKPQRSGYSYEPTDRRSRTDMEVGSVLRVNYDTDETKISCTLILDQVQSAWFEQFERRLLAQGSQWFEIPVQTGGVIDWHTARFQQRPKASIFAPFWTSYQFSLDIERRPDTLCPELMEMLICVSPGEMCGTARTLRQAMQEIVPSISLPDYWLESAA